MNVNNQIELQSSGGTALAPVGSGHLNVGRMMEFALEKLSGPDAGSAVDALGKLVELHRTIQQDEAVKNFNKAFARMQATLPDIPKSKQVSLGGGAKFTFAPLETIMPKIKPVMQANGLAVYFTEIPPIRDQKNTRTRCTLVHIDGHSINSESEAPPDNKNPMGDMHKSGGANSFTARYSLLRVLGIVPMAADTIPESLTGESITDDQRMTLESLISETKADLAKFLTYFKIDVIDNLPAGRYGEAVTALEKKQKASK